MLDLYTVVSGIEKTTSANILLNVIENTVKFNTVSVLNDNELPIAHISASSKTTSKDVIYSDYSKTIGPLKRNHGSIPYKNNEPINSLNFKYYNSRVVELLTESIAITTFANDYNKQLYYRHNCPTDTVANSIVLYYSNGQEIPSIEYRIINETDPLDSAKSIKNIVIAHAFKQKSDNLIFVKYQDTSGNSYRKVLDNAYLFYEAPSHMSFVDFTSGNPDNHLLVYRVLSTGSNYTIALPEDYYNCWVAHSPSSFIHAYVPNNELPSEPWHVKVNKFSWYAGAGFLYTVPEYMEQLFYPFAPYAYKNEDIGIIEYNNIISCSEMRPLGSLSGSYIDVLLYKVESDIPIRALTNNSSKNNQYIPSYDIYWEYVDLQTIENRGMIYSTVNMSEYDLASVSYPYVLDSITIDDIDINPFRNISLLGKSIVFYALPNSGTSAIEYLIVDQDGIIESVSQVVSTGNSDLSHMVGRMYEYPSDASESDRNTLALYVDVESDFITDYVNNNGYIILGRFFIPETLDESNYRLITSVKYDKFDDYQTLANKYPDHYSNKSSLADKRIIAKDELFGCQLIRAHWYKFSDYIPNALYSYNEFMDRLKLVFDAGVTPVIDYLGCPVLGVDINNIDISAGSCIINWHPAVQPNPDLNVGMIIYSGTSVSDISTQETDLTNATLTSSISIALSAGTKKFIQGQPYITDSNGTHLGPKTNIVCIGI